MLLFLACETGVRYDDNETIKKVSTQSAQSGVGNRSIEDLLEKNDERKEVFDDDLHPIMVANDEPKIIVEDIKIFSNDIKVNGLEVRNIREGIHNDYLRLVFDVFDSSKPAYSVGKYEASYNATKKYIKVILYDYKGFAAPIPSFPSSSIVEQIHFEQYPKEKGLKFHIQLRNETTVKVFDLKSPARLVFDINAI